MSEEEDKLELLAGVYMNPETREIEVKPAKDGVEPISLFTRVVMEHMRMAMEIQRQVQEGSPIQKGSADMFRRRPP